MKIVITGGTGFLGSALVRSLISDGHEVLSLARRLNPDYERLGVRQVSVDFGLELLAQRDALISSLSGAEVVFHVAAKVAMWGKRRDFYTVNVEGTRTLLALARQCGVRRFIYTSSPSVIATGQDLVGVNEAAPYPDHFEAFYPETKSLAEREVLAAHCFAFQTIALRPHLIFGPGDTNLIPTILEKAKAGRLAIIGSGTNRVDFSYIDDCVAAHRCAERALGKDATVGGRAYFISQGEPMVLWDFINAVLTGLGQKPVTKRISRSFAHRLAALMEFSARLTGSQPALTRFLVSEMATEHFFDISAAKRLLGYDPQVSVEEGIRRTLVAMQMG